MRKYFLFPIYRCSFCPESLYMRPNRTAMTAVAFYIIGYIPVKSRPYTWYACIRNILVFKYLFCLLLIRNSKHNSKTVTHALLMFTAAERIYEVSIKTFIFQPKMFINGFF